MKLSDGTRRKKRAYPGNFVAVDKLPLNTALCVDYFTTIKKFSSTKEREYPFQTRSLA